jgi:tetratricopeptide (TPR) repeat protein
MPFRRLADLYYSLAIPGRALETSSAAIKIDPNHSLAWFVYAWASAQLGNHADSILAYNKAIELSCPDPFSLSDRGTEHNRQGEADLGLADADASILLQPNYYFAWFVKGHAHWLKGDTDQAGQCLRTSIELCPPEAAMYAAQLQSCRQSGNLADVFKNSWAARAWAHLVQCEYRHALLEFNQAIHIAPDNSTLFSGRSEAFSGLGHFDRALAEAEEAMRLDPNHAYGWEARALAYLEVGNTNSALADFDKALRLDPKNVRLLCLRGQAYYIKGKYQQTFADCTEAVRLDPDYGHAYIWRANANRHLDQHEAAMADYDRAISLLPTDAHAYQARGLAYERSDELDLAIADYDQAIRLAPTDASNFLYRARAHLGNGDLARTFEDVTQAIRLDPSSREAYLVRAEAHEFLGDDAAAAEDRRIADERSLQ